MRDGGERVRPEWEGDTCHEAIHFCTFAVQGIQRPKASYLNRISYGRTLQSQMRSVANRMPTVAVDAASTSVPQSSHDSGQRPGNQVGIVSSNTWGLIANFFLNQWLQSLRPLMERLESHFRLQRQTMGILAQLNEAAAMSTSSNEGASSTTNLTGSWESDGSVSASFSDSGVASRPWALDFTVFVTGEQEETDSNGRVLSSQG